MNVQTGIKSGALLDTAASQLNAAASGVSNFVNQAGQEAEQVTSFVTNKATALWNALVG